MVSWLGCRKVSKFIPLGIVVGVVVVIVVIVFETDFVVVKPVQSG